MSDVLLATARSIYDRWVSGDREGGLAQLVAADSVALVAKVLVVALMDHGDDDTAREIAREALSVYPIGAAGGADGQE